MRELLVENTPNDLATPERLKELLKALNYPDLGVCFDTGHAHMMSSVHQAFGVLEFAYIQFFARGVLHNDNPDSAAVAFALAVRVWRTLPIAVAGVLGEPAKRRFPEVM